MLTNEGFEFYTKGGRLSPAPFYIWGIVNCTPNSFFDGGLYSSSEKSISRAKKLWLDGANILDLGGASSRPGSEDVPAELEWERIEKTLFEILEFFKNKESLTSFASSGKNNLGGSISPPMVSVDTWRAKVAEKALQAGVEIINDISGFAFDEDLFDVLVDYKPGYVLMHSLDKPLTMQDNINYENVILTIYEFFEKKINKLVQKGLPERNIILDLGIGFGKNLQHNLELLQHIEKFNDLKRPILLGLSNKSMFADLFGLEKNQRGSITQVCSALMQAKGVRHHRVHDVLATWQSLTLNNILRYN